MAAPGDNLTSETAREFSLADRWLCRKRNIDDYDICKYLRRDRQKEVGDPRGFETRNKAESFATELIFCTFKYPFSHMPVDELESKLADRLASRLTRFDTVYQSEKTIFHWFFSRTSTKDPKIKKEIREDRRAAVECNPIFACDYLNCFLNSRGFLARQACRAEHKLRSRNNKPMVRKTQKLASKAFGIDIHPGAKIGSGIFIDDAATGVFIGNSEVIGDNTTTLNKNFYFYRGNSLAQIINGESLSALTDEKSVFNLYDDTSKFVSGIEKSIHGIRPAGAFHQKFYNISPGNGHGRECYKDGGCQFLKIQVHEGDHDSPPSIQLASSAMKTAKFAWDQNDKQPPPHRFPSYIKPGTEIVQEKSEFNLSGLAKAFLLISVNECLAASAVGLVAGKVLPVNARILLSSAGFCSLAGFLLCSCGYVFQNSRGAKLASRLMTAAGVVAATFAFVFIMGSLAIVINRFIISDFNFSV